MSEPINREIFALTPTALVDFKLELAEIKASDLVVDLGCGDAEVLVRACKKYGVKGLGLEILPEALTMAYAKISAHQMEDKIQILEEDMMSLDFSVGDVYILYLNRRVLGSLSIKLENELKPGARIVTHDFDLPGWEAKEVFEYTTNTFQNHSVFLYQR